MGHIIIQDPGHGDLISVIPPISGGVSAGVIARVGLASALDLDMAMVMATDITVVVGGARPTIIPHAGVGGMADPGLMDFMATISMFTTMSMSTIRTMCTGIGLGYPARVITGITA